jgi:hypothetical protein
MIDHIAKYSRTTDGMFHILPGELASACPHPGQIDIGRDREHLERLEPASQDQLLIRWPADQFIEEKGETQSIQTLRGGGKPINSSTRKKGKKGLVSCTRSMVRLIDDDRVWCRQVTPRRCLHHGHGGPALPLPAGLQNVATAQSMQLIDKPLGVR